jgi:hypothetical protein
MDLQSGRLHNIRGTPGLGDVRGRDDQNVRPTFVITGIEPCASSIATLLCECHGSTPHIAGCRPWILAQAAGPVARRAYFAFPRPRRAITSPRVDHAFSRRRTSHTRSQPVGRKFLLSVCDWPDWDGRASWLAEYHADSAQLIPESGGLGGGREPSSLPLE